MKLSNNLKRKIPGCPPHSSAGKQLPALLGIVPALKFDSGAIIVLKSLLDLYPDILKQIKLSENQILAVIDKLRYYYKLGYGFNQWPKFKESLKAEFKYLPPLELVKIPSFISGITKDQYPAAFNYLLNKNDLIADFKTDAEQKKILTTKKNESLKYELVDKLDRGAGAIAQASKIGLKKIAPVLILAGIAGAGYFAWKKGFFKKKEYLTNPINKAAAAANKYREFHDLEPNKRYSINQIDTSELIELGNVLDIGYESKKWTNQKENYLHEFGKHVKIYQTLDGKSLIINGGKMKVTSQGITN